MTDEEAMEPTVIEFRRSKMHGEMHYIVAGKDGSIDFHVFTSDFMGDRVGGVEFHHRHAPYYMDATKPSHKSCWAMLDKGPCWHDGTSLWASEYWIPLLDNAGEEAVFSALEREYVKHFSKKTDE